MAHVSTADVQTEQAVHDGWQSPELIIGICWCEAPERSRMYRMQFSHPAKTVGRRKKDCSTACAAGFIQTRPDCCLKDLSLQYTTASRSVELNDCHVTTWRPTPALGSNLVEILLKPKPCILHKVLDSSGANRLKLEEGVQQHRGW